VSEADSIPFEVRDDLPPPPTAEEEALLARSERNGAAPDAAAAGLRTRGVLLDRVRPLRWLWAKRVPMGLPSIVIGEEGVGKGTFVAWFIARATCGELEGDCMANR
jgi:hypothetical protein